MKRTRVTMRWTIALAAIAAVTAGCSSSGNTATVDCDTYPDGDVTMTIGRSAGGGHDDYARVLQPLLEKELDTTVVIKNIDGAGGRVAAEQLQRGKPDGLTIHLMEPNGLAALQVVDDSVGYDLEKLTMLGIVNDRPSTFAVSAKSDIDTYEELVAKGKDKALKFATAGLSSPNFINGIIATEASDMKIEPVPHEGSSEAITSVVRGDTDFTVFSGDSIAESVKAGDLKALVQFGSEPLDTLSDVPLASAVGLDSLEGVLTSNLILVAPPELPTCVQDKLTDAVQNTLNSKEFADFGATAGRIVTPGTAEDGAELITRALATYKDFSDVYKDYLTK